MDIVILSDILLFLSPALSRKTPTQVTSSSLRASRGNDTSQFICQNEDTNLSDRTLGLPIGTTTSTAATAAAAIFL